MNDLNVFVDLKNTLSQLENVVEKLILKAEIDLQFAQDHIGELITNAKDLEDCLDYLDKHSADEELSSEQLQQLEKIISEAKGNKIG